MKKKCSIRSRIPVIYHLVIYQRLASLRWLSQQALLSLSRYFTESFSLFFFDSCDTIFQLDDCGGGIENVFFSDEHFFQRVDHKNHVVCAGQQVKKKASTFYLTERRNKRLKKE